ncbi:Elongation factor P [Caulifigura coniformis]|uniref:Elongation factor P n=1 Tax=Caulifigura coniformis TaxID=2527983 RepID=A0A517SDR2_9PLAN|nr:elongation factor P [Caulifigura coniformis]QDT54259.1 Elongation factor P [Caulifigura coniformis]
MAVFNAGEFRKGIKVIVESDPYEMVHCDFVKPGKGQALYKCKMRNLLKGSLLDRTYRSGDSLEAADIRNVDGIYSYFDSQDYIFMDNESFEQVGLSKDICGQQMRFIKEGSPCQLMYWNEKLIGVTPPTHIVLEITYTEPAARGNTATNVTKPATVETGGEIQVPSFISTGEKVKIDTESGNYLGRVND